jgi:hypothetical protein
VKGCVSACAKTIADEWKKKKRLFLQVLVVEAQGYKEAKARKGVAVHAAQSRE